ncbi:MAG: histidine kinase dimerization/phospho-acceptor domain-containing protein [Candidatus Binatia bacterium]
MATILVIDASASVRETLRIVLGHEHEVAVARSLDEPAARGGCDVVVLGLPPRPRDDRALGSALTQLAPKAPLLLLHAASDVEQSALVPHQVPVEFLAKPFDAYGVRARVRTLLGARRPSAVVAEPVPDAGRWREFPFVSHAAAAVMRQIATADLPVTLIYGEPGTGTAAVARAMHDARERRGPWLALAGGRLAPGELSRRLSAADGIATVYVSDVEQASEEIQGEMWELIEDQRRQVSPTVRLILGAREDLGALAATARFRSELAYALTTLPITLLPLRERAGDVAALVEVVTRVLSRRLRLGAVRYAPAALDRLRDYLWFGNVAELEAVVMRTLVLRRPAVVEADDLVFLPEDVDRALLARTDVSPVLAAPTSSTVPAIQGLDLEVVLGELAHELKNPMVTIKTFAQHLDSVLADPEVRERFSALTTEAIGRMDDLLETLLDFARFRAPTRRPVDVQALLDRALDEQRDALALRHVTVERNGARAGMVDADEQQMLFAFRSLCRGLVTDLVPHTPLTVRAGGRGAVEMQLQAGSSTAARLAAWVDSPNGASETPPLTWALAAALVERNGGVVRVRREDSGSTIVRIEWSQPNG